MARKNYSNQRVKNASQKDKIAKYAKEAKKMAKAGNYQDAFADKQRSHNRKGFRSLDDGPEKIRTRSSNDSHWYFKSSNILADVASFSFEQALGNPIDMTKQNNSAENSAAALTIPGLMSLELMLTPGISVDAQSPMNLAAQAAYTVIRKNNSGAVNYNAPDLMLYYLAMDNIYSAWKWMQRIYGEAKLYSSRNKYMPRAYAKADHFDLDDIVANLADFRGYLNMAADRISSFCVPATFNLMVRHAWLFSNIYKDSDTHKGQQYMYTPATFYQYDETSSPTGGVLAPVDVSVSNPNVQYTYVQLRSMLDDMINALQYSEDIGTMSGDVLKAYGESGLFTLSHIEPDYTVVPVMDKEVLTQIENAIFFPYAELVTKANLPQFVVKQDPNTNYIKYQPVIPYPTGVTSYGGWKGNYLNFHHDNPTPEDVMVASRLNVSFVADNTNKNITITDIGSELALRCRVIFFGQSADLSAVAVKPYSRNLALQVMDMRTLDFNSTNPNFPLKDLVLRLYLWVAFDWAPQLFAAWFGAKLLMLPSFRDWDVYTFIDTEDLFSINELALLSLFNIPS